MKLNPYQKTTILLPSRCIIVADTSQQESSWRSSSMKASPQGLVINKLLVIRCNSSDTHPLNINTPLFFIPKLCFSFLFIINNIKLAQLRCRSKHLTSGYYALFYIYCIPYSLLTLFILIKKVILPKLTLLIILICKSLSHVNKCKYIVLRVNNLLHIWGYKNCDVI